MGLVLGIDPGSLITGYGIVDERDGDLHAVIFGVLEAGSRETLARRLLTIGQGLNALFDKYKPASVALEKTFYAKNVDSVTKLGQARGVCLYEAARAQVPVFEYAPTEIKSSLAGSGRASKDQVQFLVRTLLKLPAMEKFDMSDALALAIHHSRISTTKNKIREMELNP